MQLHHYDFDPQYSSPTAYFCMEYGVDQALKIFSGGLGFLAGSHMQAAHDLRQNLVGIGILWKYGYYDQIRQSDTTMDVLFQKKKYNFLEDHDIIVPIYVNNHQVFVKALLLRPETFQTAPLFLLTTDIAENDHLARTITHKLYDNHPSTRMAQSMVLGIGGAKVLEAVGFEPATYHLNEGHALPLAFHLYKKHERSVQEVKNRMVFTTHTPERAGNEEHNLQALYDMGFFGSLPLSEIREITQTSGQMLSYTPVAMRLSKVANGVSQMHGKVSREMWAEHQGICEIKAITNAQSQRYWSDQAMDEFLAAGDDAALEHRKRHLKKRLFKTVADQTGKLFDPDVLTITWARRFAEYKRADLLLRDMMRFKKLCKRTEKKVQIIWAGKPYPLDENSISVFNHLVEFTEDLGNCAVLTGYEMDLSALLKKGTDVWLNTPRRPREASGTSGMTAAMNAAINFSISDGWVIEFAEHGKNAFIIPPVDPTLPIDQQDTYDAKNLMDILEYEVIPLYYDRPEEWHQMVKNSMQDVVPYFDAKRMADEYYKLIYHY